MSTKGDGDVTVTSTLVVPVTEFRTKWERLWPKDEKSMKCVTSQIGFLNTVNTARVYSDGEQTWCWVVHNKLPPKSSASVQQTFTSSCFIQPTANR